MPDFPRVGEVGGGEEAIVSLLKPGKQIRRQTGGGNPIEEELGRVQKRRQSCIDS